MRLGGDGGWRAVGRKCCLATKHGLGINLPILLSLLLIYKEILSKYVRHSTNCRVSVCPLLRNRLFLCKKARRCQD